MNNRARWTMALCGASLLASPPSEAASAQRGCVVVRAVARYGGVGYHHLS
ncbi:MAG TPA: hypothetical protein VJN18_20065 [Polyangiaceae bacterium]|nr:hypothetical protein [Polyangiaceae bacterium]